MSHQRSDLSPKPNHAKHTSAASASALYGDPAIAAAAVRHHSCSPSRHHTDRTPDNSIKLTVREEGNGTPDVSAPSPTPVPPERTPSASSPILQTPQLPQPPSWVVVGSTVDVPPTPSLGAHDADEANQRPTPKEKKAKRQRTGRKQTKPEPPKTLQNDDCNDEDGGLLHPCIRVFGKCEFEEKKSDTGEVCRFAFVPRKACRRHLLKRCGGTHQCGEVHLSEEEAAGFFLLSEKANAALGVKRTKAEQEEDTPLVRTTNQAEKEEDDTDPGRALRVFFAQPTFPPTCSSETVATDHQLPPNVTAAPSALKHPKAALSTPEKTKTVAFSNSQSADGGEPATTKKKNRTPSAAGALLAEDSLHAADDVPSPDTSESSADSRSPEAGEDEREDPLAVLYEAKRALQESFTQGVHHRRCRFCVWEDQVSSGEKGKKEHRTLRGHGYHTIADCPQLLARASDGTPLLSNTLLVFMEQQDMLLLFRTRTFPVLDDCEPGERHRHATATDTGVRHNTECPWGKLKYNNAFCIIVDIEPPSDEVPFDDVIGEDLFPPPPPLRLGSLHFHHVAHLISRVTCLVANDITLFHPWQPSLFYGGDSTSSPSASQATRGGNRNSGGGAQIVWPFAGSSLWPGCSTLSQEFWAPSPADTNPDAPKVPLPAPTFHRCLRNTHTPQDEIYVLHATTTPMHYVEGRSSAAAAAAQLQQPDLDPSLQACPTAQPLLYRWTSVENTAYTDGTADYVARNTALQIHEGPLLLSAYLVSAATCPSSATSAGDHDVSPPGNPMHERPVEYIAPSPTAVFVVPVARFTPSTEALGWMSSWAHHQLNTVATVHKQILQQEAAEGARDPSPSQTGTSPMASILHAEEEARRKKHEVKNLLDKLLLSVPVPTPRDEALSWCCDHCHRLSLADFHLRNQSAVFYFTNIGVTALTSLSVPAVHSWDGLLWSTALPEHRCYLPRTHTEFVQNSRKYPYQVWFDAFSPGFLPE